MKKIFVLYIFALLLVGCSARTTEEFMEKAPFPESTVILYEESIDKGKIIIYKDESGFRHVFYSDKLEYWNHSGNVDLIPRDGFNWTMTNDPNVVLATFAGIMTTKEIKDVIVKQKTIEKEAKVIQKDGFSVWFVYFDTLEEADSGQPDPLKIEATDKYGKVLWKEGIYDGEHFRGSTL